jgi:hypothetical protein
VYVEATTLAGPDLNSTWLEPEFARTLPEPTRRWLARSVSPETPPYTCAQLMLEGYLKLGSWHRFTAEQTIRPRHGYRWTARTRVAGVRLLGAERMNPSEAARSWQAAGLFQLGRADGPELLNSAAGRLAAESVFVPTTAGLATWEPAADSDSAFAYWRIGARVDRVRIQVAPSGRLRSVSLRRWGTPPAGPYGRHPFGLRLEGELTVQGLTIPRVVTASWWWGSDRQDEGTFLRAEVVAARFA